MDTTELQTLRGTDMFSASNFEHSQRVAVALSKSDLVPKEYKNNVSNTIIALDIAFRIGASPLMVMQHLHIIQGKPSWSSTFLIAAINNSGKFKTQLRFEKTENGCYAWAVDLSGQRLESPEITMQMANAEGWTNKTGSKWKTMPELMMRYRAASFFSRLYCPEITMGMHTVEEIEDIGHTVVTSKPVKSKEEIENDRMAVLVNNCKSIDSLNKLREDNPNFDSLIFDMRAEQLKVK